MDVQEGDLADGLVTIIYGASMPPRSWLKGPSARAPCYQKSFLGAKMTSTLKAETVYLVPRYWPNPNSKQTLSASVLGTLNVLWVSYRDHAVMNNSVDHVVPLDNVPLMDMCRGKDSAGTMGMEASRPRYC